MAQALYGTGQPFAMGIINAISGVHGLSTVEKMVPAAQK
jgi:hypothetical protein